MYRKLSAEVSQSEIAYMKNQGMTIKEIADRLDCSRSTIIRYLPVECKKTKCRRVASVLGAQDIKDIIELHKSGTPVQKIAEAYDRSRETIYAILHQNGVSCRKYNARVQKQQSEQHKIVAKTIPANVDGRFQKREVTLFESPYGEYILDKRTNEVKIGDRTMNKEDLGYYIRDLMSLWREMK